METNIYERIFDCLRAERGSDKLTDLNFNAQEIYKFISSKHNYCKYCKRLNEKDQIKIANFRKILRELAFIRFDKIMRIVNMGKQ